MNDSFDMLRRDIAAVRGDIGELGAEMRAQRAEFAALRVDVSEKFARLDQRLLAAAVVIIAALITGIAAGVAAAIF